MTRPLLLFLHLAGAILLFSTYLTAFTTKTLGDRTRDPRVLAHVYDVMKWMDRVLTPLSSVIRTSDWQTYDRLARRWVAWAGTSFFLTVVILYLMVHR